MQHLHDVFLAQSVTVTQIFAHIFWHCSLCPITEHATAAAASGDIGGRVEQRRWQRPYRRGEVGSTGSYYDRNGGASYSGGSGYGYGRLSSCRTLPCMLPFGLTLQNSAPPDTSHLAAAPFNILTGPPLHSSKVTENQLQKF